jgi:hypothetical protein
MSNFWISLLVILAGILVIGIALFATYYTRDIRAAHKRLESLGSRVICLPASGSMA